MIENATMVHIFTQLLDSLFPPSEDAQIVRMLEISDADREYAPRVQKGIASIASMQSRLVRAAIHEAKYHNNLKAHAYLGALLSLWLVDHIFNETVIVPVPLSSKRKRERGHNQVTSIARACITMSSKSNVALRDDVLLRTKHTNPQTRLQKDARLNNVQGAFALQNDRATYADLRNKDIILLDDVTTTGATLREAAQPLRALHPKSLTLLAIAH